MALTSYSYISGLAHPALTGFGLEPRSIMSITKDTDSMDGGGGDIQKKGPTKDSFQIARGTASTPTIPNTASAVTGAATDRTPEELGEVPPTNLIWEPCSHVYELASTATETKWIVKMTTPVQFNPNSGFYELPMPLIGTVYFIGHHEIDPNKITTKDASKCFQDVIRAVRRRSPRAVSFVFIPLKQKHEQPPLPPLHAVIENIGGKATIRPIGAGITVIFSDNNLLRDQYNNSLEDQYAEANQGAIFVGITDQRQRLRLASGIIIYLGRSI